MSNQMVRLIEPSKPMRPPSTSSSSSMVAGRRDSSPEPIHTSEDRSPYRTKVDLNMRKNMAILALKDRVLDREKHMLDLLNADPFTPLSNFQDTDGNFLPRTRSNKHVSTKLCSYI